ncbi:MAG: sigma-70 family RNA polymerase sigma factor [Phycisphaeraceae bacterium]|nr:sigma-70 family RNA polymerase sigma factor [Phycisphaeraceae bacterium]
MAEQFSLDKTLTAAAAGDGQAWTQLVSAYSGRVFGLIYKQCRDRELAEEISQETFVKVVQKLTSDGYSEQGKFEPWLFRIAMNKLRDEMRRRGRQARPMDMSPAATASSNDNASGWAAAESGVIAGGPSMPRAPLDQLDRAEQVDLLRQAIATLPEADQEVLHLRHTAGLSFAQIAETLDQPLGTVLARGHRALGKLKTLMNPHADTQAKTA